MTVGQTRLQCAKSKMEFPREYFDVTSFAFFGAWRSAGLSAFTGFLPDLIHSPALSAGLNLLTGACAGLNVSPALVPDSIHSPACLPDSIHSPALLPDFRCCPMTCLAGQNGRPPDVGSTLQAGKKERTKLVLCLYQQLLPKYLLL